MGWLIYISNGIRQFFNWSLAVKKSSPVRLELTIYRLTACRLNQLGHRDTF